MYNFNLALPFRKINLEKVVWLEGKIQTTVLRKKVKDSSHIQFWLAMPFFYYYFLFVGLEKVLWPLVYTLQSSFWTQFITQLVIPFLVFLVFSLPWSVTLKWSILDDKMHSTPFLLYFVFWVYTRNINDLCTY